MAKPPRRTKQVWDAVRQSAICNLQSAIYNLQSAIYNLQSAICNLQSAIYNLHWHYLVHYAY
ncbi:hypothetical protein [Candidatus Viridilinea mediisalina]|uniref:hypothetical protein n=1 Tax=Candidatus Viridilinea mediisalina TaxID=2024553 RepID=UPI0013FE46B5|nr:hypothetical protein [Candidatus Viridilinea mediisalina]